MTRGPWDAGSTAVWRDTPGGARLGFTDERVVKVHARRTDPAVLGDRLMAVGGPGLSDVFVQPLERAVGRAVDGRPMTVWPRVEVLDPQDAAPWAGCGSLLARLHQVAGGAESIGWLPRHGGADRLMRARRRMRTLRCRSGSSAKIDLLVELGARLRDELAAPRRGGDAQRPRPRVVHGDWHLGQVAVTDEGLRLLDVDDLGTGDPAWDLARPAGFWAAGLLEDDDWQTFLAAYRRGGGPGVPADGDPWPWLDLPARCAVYVAAVREVAAAPSTSPGRSDDDHVAALLATCARMTRMEP